MAGVTAPLLGPALGERLATLAGLFLLSRGFLEPDGMR